MAEKKKRNKAAAKAEAARRWTHWLRSEGAPLLLAGLPDEVLRDEAHWTDFCTHGRLHMHSATNDFSVNDIEDEAGLRLLEFLERVLTPEEKPYSVLYRRLRDRASSR